MMGAMPKQIGAQTDALTILADLARYGIVAAAAPQALDPVPSAAVPLRFAGDKASMPSASPALRAALAQTGEPVCHPHVVSVMALGALTQTALVVQIPAVTETETQRFLSHLQRAQREAVATRIAMLREIRRQALGLPARTDDETVQAAIRASFVAPVMSRTFAAATGATVHVTLEAPAASEDAIDVPLLSPEIDDPLSINPFALAIRSTFFCAHAKPLRGLFRCTPHAFGRGLSRKGHASQGDLMAALAMIELSFLSIPSETNHV